MVNNIIKAHNTTQVVALNVFNDLFSLDNMWYQVAGVITAMKQLPSAFDDGYICIGFSQGRVKTPLD